MSNKEKTVQVSQIPNRQNTQLNKGRAIDKIEWFAK